jgi:hypothetical protein
VLDPPAVQSPAPWAAAPSADDLDQQDTPGTGQGQSAKAKAPEQVCGCDLSYGVSVSSQQF